MKRIISALLLIFLLAISLCACGGNEAIEEYEWTMRQAWNSNDGTVVAIAASEASELYANAAVVTVTLTAKDGAITITDETNGKVYTGTYEVDSRTPDGTNYVITINGEVGYATVAMTKHYDGKEVPTLPINIGSYSMYFYEKV